MARKKGRGAGPGAGPQPQKPAGVAVGGGGGWTPLRDSIRRDVEQAISALAFAERLHQKMDTQRRAFLDFPRIMEQLRSGAVERLTTSLSRLYEGGQGFDLQRFLRDLPLALGQLAAADKTKSEPPPPGVQPAPPGVQAQTPSPVPEPVPTPAPEPAPVPEPEPAPAAPVSPRLELRSKLLAAAPNLAKAAQSYRRNVATLRRAALPRRSPGPWRADREVLEEARRAVEFVQKLYDAYADGWADQPLTKDLGDQTAAELDRFLAWTQLDRYVELAVLASTNVVRASKPGQHVISAAKEVVAQPPVTEASPGVVVADSEPGPAGEPEEEPASLEQPVLEPELGRD
ncbi:MAG: hypothetical protein E6J86_17435 [Deltaproteobacteria bacterium]|nr:MAG: hypothetical protein E6J86_17435 [Deltaproteobacteria bacterium]